MAQLIENFKFEQDGKTYSLYNLPDGFVIEGDVDLEGKGLTELPDLSKVTVTGYFNCSNNALTSLRGAPREVGGDFGCFSNQLTSLQGAPQKVGGGFWCEDNKLTTLKGAPQKTGDSFVCSNNQLTTLEGAPKEVGGGFSCKGNELTTLRGAPQKITRDFNCAENPDLSSLFGISEMLADKKIDCDYWVMTKYGSPDPVNGCISYSVLTASAKYKSELAAYNIKKKHEERMQKEAEMKAKHKSGFATFKKMKAEERE